MPPAPRAGAADVPTGETGWHRRRLGAGWHGWHASPQCSLAGIPARARANRLQWGWQQPVASGVQRCSVVPTCDGCASQLAESRAAEPLACRVPRFSAVFADTLASWQLAGPNVSRPAERVDEGQRRRVCPKNLVRDRQPGTQSPPWFCRCGRWPGPAASCRIAGSQDIAGPTAGRRTMAARHALSRRSAHLAHSDRRASDDWPAGREKRGVCTTQNRVRVSRPRRMSCGIPARPRPPCAPAPVPSLRWVAGVPAVPCQVGVGHAGRTGGGRGGGWRRGLVSVSGSGQCCCTDRPSGTAARRHGGTRYERACQHGTAARRHAEPTTVPPASQPAQSHSDEHSSSHSAHRARRSSSTIERPRARPPKANAGILS